MKKILILIGAIGLSILLTYIFTPRPYQVHWHADFAVYMSGELVDFSSDMYMEEVARCNITTDVQPEDRIHLHDNKGGLIHVHMAGSTWGHLFSNLSWNIGSNFIADPYGNLYLADEKNALYYFINGQRVENPNNELVKSTDRLLVWYGTGSPEDVGSRWETLVTADADEYNHKPDPASCGSNSYGWLSPIVAPLLEWKESLPHSHN